MREISYVLYARARADDAKIVRSRNGNAKLRNHLKQLDYELQISIA